MKKPCINCGEDCDILPVQLGDSFTLTYLRVCGGECMFIVAYDYLYEIGHHKYFRNKLYDMQNEEDKKECDEFIDFTTKMSLEDFKKHLEANPKMLSTPMPEDVLKMFSEGSRIPQNSTCTMRFTRPSKEDRIKWQKVHVKRLENDLEEAIRDLEAMTNER